MPTKDLVILPIDHLAAQETLDQIYMVNFIVYYNQYQCGGIVSKTSQVQDPIADCFVDFLKVYF